MLRSGEKWEGKGEKKKEVCIASINSRRGASWQRRQAIDYKCFILADPVSALK
jgi:hypothetical protein